MVVTVAVPLLVPVLVIGWMRWQLNLGLLSRSKQPNELG
jgi:hypothetical protein